MWYPKKRETGYAQMKKKEGKRRFYAAPEKHLSTRGGEKAAEYNV